MTHNDLFNLFRSSPSSFDLVQRETFSFEDLCDSGCKVVMGDIPDDHLALSEADVVNGCSVVSVWRLSKGLVWDVPV